MAKPPNVTDGEWDEARGILKPEQKTGQSAGGWIAMLWPFNWPFVRDNLMGPGNKYWDMPRSIIWLFNIAFIAFAVAKFRATGDIDLTEFGGGAALINGPGILASAFRDKVATENFSAIAERENEGEQ